MIYQPIIGLEVHIELSTKSKMYCRCSADYFGAKPNTHTCAICLGLPGTMPKANEMAIEYTQKLGLALNCKPLLSSKFDRKNYFYPDLPKGFQISQYQLPFSQKGYLEINIDAKNKKVGITRAHLEEDTGKLTHATVKGKRVTLIDFNRSGVPLVEIVSDPDIRSAQEAKVYAQKLQQIVRYLGISDANMEKGSMRIEPNVSLRKFGQKKLPSYKIELKNINSFRFAEKAINFEIERQKALLEKGQLPHQETRGWNESKGVTFLQRSKELAHDYRYFPEPDLPPFTFGPAYSQKLKKELPELPDSKISRFVVQYKLSLYDAALLAQDWSLADFFEEAVKAYGREEVKPIANWITQELLRRLNETGKSISQIDLMPASLVSLQYLLDRGKITRISAKEMFDQMIKTGKDPQELIKVMAVGVLPKEQLAPIIKEVIAQNPKAKKDYKGGKQASLEYLIGQVQRQAQGKADPQLVRQLIIEKIK